LECVHAQVRQPGCVHDLIYKIVHAKVNSLSVSL
jgi:hypothetical protein